MGAQHFFASNLPLAISQTKDILILPWHIPKPKIETTTKQTCERHSREYFIESYVDFYPLLVGVYQLRTVIMTTSTTPYIH